MTISENGVAQASRQQQLQRAIEGVHADIQKACNAVGRDASSVCLLAVSKTKPASDIAAAYQAGQRYFGENYVQEGVEKITQLAHLAGISWHFIGPLQSNKTKDVATHFDWMHSVERLKIAQRLHQQRPLDKAPLQILIQVNIDNEASKAGVSLSEIAPLAQQIQQLDRLCLRGLMAIPQAGASAEQQTQSFTRLADAFKQLQHSYSSVDTLSLGMSSDLAAAIEHGSTMVRIGTAIFGQRHA